MTTDQIEDRQEKINRINSSINVCHFKLKAAAAFPDNGIYRDFWGTFLQIAIANFDIMDVIDPEKMKGYTGFSQYVALRPTILKAYEIGKALAIWAKELHRVSVRIGMKNGNERINLYRKKNREALKKIDKLAKIRNSAGHAVSDSPSGFIKSIESLDINILKEIYPAVVECLTALLFDAKAIAEALLQYRPPTDRSATVRS